MYVQYCRVKDNKHILCNLCYVSLNNVSHARLVTYIYLVRGEYQGNYRTNRVSSLLERVRVGGGWVGRRACVRACMRACVRACVCVGIV